MSIEKTSKIYNQNTIEQDDDNQQEDYLLENEYDTLDTENGADIDENNDIDYYSLSHLDELLNREGCDYNDIAKKLIDNGKSWLLSGYQQFHDLNSEVANKLIDNDQEDDGYGEKDYSQSEFLANNLAQFKNLDANVANRLIDHRQGESVLINLERFQGLDYNEIANRLIITNQGRYLVENLEKFNGLDHNDIANRLINNKQGIDLTNNLEKFNGLNYNDIANKLINNGQAHALAWNLKKFNNLESKIANELIDNGERLVIDLYLEKFQNLDHKDIVDRLINSGGGESVARNLDKFIGIDHNDVVDKLINSDQGSAVAWNLEKFNNLDHKDIASRLIDKGKGKYVIENIDKFQNLDTDITNKLINSGLGNLVIEKLDKFKGQDHKDIAIRLIDNGLSESVIKNISKFNEQNHNEIANKLFNIKQFKISSWEIDKFKNLGSDIAIKLINNKQGELVINHLGSYYNLVPEVANALIDNGLGYRVIDNLDRFNIVDYNDIAKRLIAQKNIYEVANNLSKLNNLDANIADIIIDNGHAWGIAENLDKFHDLDYKDIAIKLIDKRFGESVIRNLDKFIGIDHNDIVSKLIDNNLDNLVFKNINKFHELGTEVFNKMINIGRIRDIVNHFEAFNKISFTVDFLENYLTTNGYKFINIYNYSEQRIRWVDRAIALLGIYVPVEVIIATRDVLSTDKELPEYLQELSITKHNEVGMSQLKNVISAIQNNLIYDFDDHQDNDQQVFINKDHFINSIFSNPVAKSIAQRLTRFEDSQWGSHGQDKWASIINEYNVSKDILFPLPEGFLPSKEFEISEINDKEINNINIEDDVVRRYDVLLESINHAVDIFDKSSTDDGKYEIIYKSAKELIINEIDSLKQSLEKTDINENAKININKKIDNLTNLKDIDIDNFIKLMRGELDSLIRLNIKDMDKVARSFFFIEAMFNSNPACDLAKEIKNSDKSKPTIDNLQDILTLKDYIIDDNFRDIYFDNEESLTCFKKICNTDSLEKQILKVQDLEAYQNNNNSIQFVPSRGLLLELSGHIADACWASKYKSIAKEFPNLSSVTFVKNPNKTNESLVGSCLLFNTIDLTTNENIILIRGVNPIENYINKVKVEEFYDSLIEYVKSIAGDKKVALVFDDHCGGAMTNRSVLYNYITNNVHKGFRTESIRLPADTTFNNYDLSLNSSRGSAFAQYID